TESPLRSTIAPDDIMGPLVSFFTSDAPLRVAAIQAATERFDLADLRTIAHQLRGSAKTYGFEPIGEAAAKLEQDLAAEPDNLDECTRDLVSLLVRVRAA